MNEFNTISKAMPYLTFGLGEEKYAVEITNVREVLKYTKVTKIPKTPDYMCGVINLRGGVVSVVDLNMKFGMPKTADIENANIIILELTMKNNEMILLGALVDSVQEVLELEHNQIENTPRLGMSVNLEFIKGIGKKGEEFLIILDMNKIFSVADLTIVKDLKQELQTSEAADKN